MSWNKVWSLSEYSTSLQLREEKRVSKTQEHICCGFPFRWHGNRSAFPSLIKCTTVFFFQGVKCVNNDCISLFIKDSEDKQGLFKNSSVLLPHVGRNDDDNNNSKGIVLKMYTSFARFAFHYGQKRGAYSTWYSQVVTHPGTNQALPSLASEIRRDRAFSRWYGHKPRATLQIQDTTCHLKHSHITTHSTSNLFRVIQASRNSYSKQRLQVNMLFFLERGSPFNRAVA